VLCLSNASAKHASCFVHSPASSSVCVSHLLLCPCPLQAICHGDVYGHNLLYDDASGQVTLCDFGASFCYDKEQRFWEAMEVGGREGEAPVCLCCTCCGAARAAVLHLCACIRKPVYRCTGH
jgi:hypothetical protein